MWDVEIRITMTGTGKVVETVGVFVMDPDGVWSIADAWEVGPFDTMKEITDRAMGRARHQLQARAPMS